MWLEGPGPATEKILLAKNVPDLNQYRIGVVGLTAMEVLSAKLVAGWLGLSNVRVRRGDNLLDSTGNPWFEDLRGQVHILYWNMPGVFPKRGGAEYPLSAEGNWDGVPWEVFEDGIAWIWLSIPGKTDEQSRAIIVSAIEEYGYVVEVVEGSYSKYVDDFYGRGWVTMSTEAFEIRRPQEGILRRPDSEVFHFLLRIRNHPRRNPFRRPVDSPQSTVPFGEASLRCALDSPQ